MTSKLTIYNGALTILGERKLATVTENRPARFKLDDIYDNDLLDRVLQHGQWNFAKRTVELQASTSTTPSFGYQFAFDKPTDFIRTLKVAADAFFQQPLTQYEDEASWWFADIETLYASYVSNDSQYGTDFSLWPPNFTEYVEHYLAYKTAPTIAGLNFNEDELEKKKDKKLLEAKATDAMESPTRFLPKGNWASARQGFGSGERGNRNQLIG